MSSFSRFYDTWFDQLHHQVHQLSKVPTPPTSEVDASHLSLLVDKLMNHYAEYYRVKSMAAERDVLTVFTAPWASSLERSLHWIAGWRPTTLFHLVYTESSILFESHIVGILRGLRTGDLGDLSPSQFRRVSELQCETVKEENAITDELSEWQDDASELVRSSSCTNLDEKIGRLSSIVHKADNLRLRTVRMVVELLTPQQAAEFFIAAAELQFGIRFWGRNQDRQRDSAEVNLKIKKAFCPPQQVEKNPCLDYIKYIIFPLFNEFKVERREKNGGEKIYESFEMLVADYECGELHPADTKPALSKAINKILQIRVAT